VSAVVWISLLVLIVSTFVAAWTVYAWRTAGPRLRLVAHDRPLMFPPDSERPLKSRVLVIDCHNSGRGSAEVHSLWLRSQDGTTTTRCERSTASSPMPATISGDSMARWVISAETLKNVPFPLTDAGALVVRPEVRWGAGRVLNGEEVALFLPRKAPNLFEEETKFGVPTVTTQPDDQP